MFLEEHCVHLKLPGGGCLFAHGRMLWVLRPKNMYDLQKTSQNSLPLNSFLKIEWHRHSYWLLYFYHEIQVIHTDIHTFGRWETALVSSLLSAQCWAETWTWACHTAGQGTTYWAMPQTTEFWCTLLSSTSGCVLVEWVKRLSMPKLKQCWVRAHHPPTHCTLESHLVQDLGQFSACVSFEDIYCGHIIWTSICGQGEWRNTVCALCSSSILLNQLKAS